VGVIYRDQSFYHLLRHANRLANMNEHHFVGMDTPQEIVHSNQLYNLEIVLFQGDHAFVSS
jgi:hypothetical protein